MRRLALILVGMFAAAITLLLFLSRTRELESGRDLLSLTPRERSEIGTMLEARSAGRASTLLQQQTGWRVEIPRIRDAEIHGVGFAEVQRGVSIPVLVFQNLDGSELQVAVVTYAFIDTHVDLFRVRSEVLKALESEGAFVLPRNHRDLLIWRIGDEIYIASTTGSRETLATRVMP